MQGKLGWKGNGMGENGMLFVYYMKRITSCYTAKSLFNKPLLYRSCWAITGWLISSNASDVWDKRESSFSQSVLPRFSFCWLPSCFSLFPNCLAPVVHSEPNTFQNRKSSIFSWLTRVLVEESCTIPFSLLSPLPKAGLKHQHIKHNINNIIT